MGVMKVAAAAAAVVIGLGAAGGGVVTNPDGSIDASGSLQRSSEIGGERVGQVLDSAGSAVGDGVGSAVSSSTVGKAAAVGVGAWAGAKVTTSASGRRAVHACWKRLSCDATPAAEPSIRPVVVTPIVVPGLGG